MRVIVFSNSSFESPHIRLGLQIMASQLAERGHEVDYAAVPTHPLDWISPARRASFRNAWLRGKDRVQVSERLVEYFLRAPFSRSRGSWWHSSQLSLYSALIPAQLKERDYDVCIRDTAMSGLFADRVRAKVRVLRINDNPDGLTGHVHPMVVCHLKNQISNKHYNELWPTTDAMLGQIDGLKGSVPMVRIPNGVFLERFAASQFSERVARTALYVGTFNGWFDVELLNRAAQLLGGWRVDLYGPYKRCLRPLSARSNVTYCGPLPFDRIPETMARYRVGLIPFAGHKKMLETIDPLKANQYLAAGLGVASTSHGHLGVGLRGLARFGDNPTAFAAAVRAADLDCVANLGRCSVQNHLQSVSWSKIMDVVEDRLLRLVWSGSC